MSADEDTELRDLVAQTLEANGTLGKLRAQLRASVFLALEEQESVQNRTPFLNKELKRFLSTEDGHLVTSLVREFLEFFHLEFTLAVFNPETGLSEEPESRSALAGQLNLPQGPSGGETPLLLEVLRSCRSGGSSPSHPSAASNSSSTATRNDLTENQIEDARKKFDEYDRDGSGAIDKDELRELFLDMFPSFNKHMLERYVNDEFRAVDRDFSSSIDFDEFLGMYKRLFLQCRSVVSGDVESILSPSHRKQDMSSNSSAKTGGPSLNSVEAKNQKNLEKSAPPLPSTPPPVSKNNRNSSSSNPLDDLLGGGDDDDSFFDDLPVSGGGLHSFGNSPSQRERAPSPQRAPSLQRAPSPNSKNRPSQIPVFASLRSDSDKKKDGVAALGTGGDASTKGAGDGKGAGNGMTSLGDLPNFLNSGSLTSAPNNKPAGAKGKEGEQNLRSLDRRMADLDFGNDMPGDFEYEDDFQSSGHSLSLKSPRSKTEGKDKTENGSIAEEIEDEEIEDISIEADDLLKSENSGFDDMTEDRSISQMDGGFDYMEDPQLP
ncbi:centrosomal protein 43-like isoform X1 [Littorina saxatilis]|uniref:Centrosomal protein 43 n=1 Tax=Littorina saxatilis TaxID=31220 RepID=A0AAN9GH95_9CAEN